MSENALHTAAGGSVEIAPCPTNKPGIRDDTGRAFAQTSRGKLVAEQAQLTHDEVRAIAELAKLSLTDDEVTMYAEQLSQILDYFTLLQEVDTSQVPPTDSVLPLRSVMRDDTPADPLTPEEATANAPDAEANQFKVNVVLSDSE